MNDKIWNNWTDNWDWILTVAKNRKWDIEPIEIKPAIHISQIESLQNALNISYPTDFKDILGRHSSGVKFDWQIANGETHGEFRPIFCGCGGVSGRAKVNNLQFSMTRTNKNLWTVTRKLTDGNNGWPNNYSTQHWSCCYTGKLAQRRCHAEVTQDISTAESPGRYAILSWRTAIFTYFTLHQKY